MFLPNLRKYQAVNFIIVRTLRELIFIKRLKKRPNFLRNIWFGKLSTDGNVSEPYITEGTINADVNLNECLKQRLLPFIIKHHSCDEILFWPDLASSHYAKKVLEFLKAENIILVPKSKNPPNLPQASPIEQFWAICKQKYAERSKPAKNLNVFSASGKISHPKLLQTMDSI